MLKMKSYCVSLHYIVSAIDLEATFRHHGDRRDLGYNIGLSATKHFIRDL